MVDLNNVSEALQRGDAEKVAELVKKALEKNLTPKKILEDGLIKGMGIIGGKFKTGSLNCCSSNACRNGYFTTQVS